jgi:hypothetical protein
VSNDSKKESIGGDGKLKNGNIEKIVEKICHPPPFVSICGNGNERKRIRLCPTPTATMEVHYQIHHV